MPRCAALLMVLLGCADPANPALPDASGATPLYEGQGTIARFDQVLVINEVSPGPGEGPDWVELKNRGSADLDLSGAFVTDAPDRLDHYYRFPSGTVLGPGAFLVVWADDGASGDGHHAPFALGRSDGCYVLAADGLALDGLLYLASGGGRSLSRIPDGEGLFVPTPPSRAAPNPEVQP